MIFVYWPHNLFIFVEKDGVGILFAVGLTSIAFFMYSQQTFDLPKLDSGLTLTCVHIFSPLPLDFLQPL